MAKFTTTNNKPYFIMGKATKYVGVSRRDDHDFTIRKGNTITLDCGVMLKLTDEFSYSHAGSFFNDTLLIAQVKPDTVRLPDRLLQREAVRVQAVTWTDKSQYKIFHDSLYAVAKYEQYFSSLTKAEREALLYGVATGAGATVTGLKAFGLFVDWVTPGGPLLPVGSIATTALSTCFTIAAAEKHTEAVRAAREQARLLERHLRQVAILAKFAGFDDDSIICNPKVQTYWTRVANFYDTVGNGFCKLGDLIASPQHLPCYHGEV
jgi:hypothetical protein